MGEKRGVFYFYMDLFAGGSDESDEEEPEREEEEEKEREERTLSLQARISRAKRRAEVIKRQRNVIDASWKIYVTTEEDVRLGSQPVAGLTFATTTTDSDPAEVVERRKEVAGILSAAISPADNNKENEETNQN